MPTLAATTACSPRRAYSFPDMAYGVRTGLLAREDYEPAIRRGWAALNGAVREGLIPDNPARRMELPIRPRARAVVWTPARVAHWQATTTSGVCALAIIASSTRSTTVRRP